MLMKKIYAFLLCGAVCLSAAADGKRFKSLKGQKVKKIARTEAAAPLWRPSSQTDFMYDIDMEEWWEMGTVNFTYDNRGNCIEELMDEDGWLSKTVTTYNEFNQPLMILKTESEDGETWENSGKTTYVYDPVVHDFFTERVGYDWNGDDWTTNYTWETDIITRNDAGNITELVKSLPMFDHLTPAYRSVWSYGADGKANEYSYYVTYDGTTWELDDDTSYKDIVWEKTNGQMTIYGDMLELTEGENLLKSAVVYYDGEPDGHYLVEYADGGFFIKETTNDINEVGRTQRMEIIDANGSMRYTSVEYFDEDGNITDEPTYTMIQEATLDEHGNVVETTVREIIDGVEELMDAQKSSCTYDANGNLTEVTTSYYDFDVEEYVADFRTVYGEYVDAAAGIESVVADTKAQWNVCDNTVAASAPGLKGLTVYNLQGVAVAKAAAEASSASVDLSSLASGIYLIHADGTGATYRFVKR